MKLTILGSGSPETYARRASSGYRLDTDAASARMVALSPSPQQIVDMAAQIGIPCVVLTHFRRHMDDAFDPAGVQTTVDWCVAEDLDSFDI